MNVKVKESNIYGVVEAPSSKSMTHRFLVTAAKAMGKSVLLNPLICDDTVATLNGLRSLGTNIQDRENKWIITGGELKSPNGAIDCKQSGTTLRLLTGIASLIDEETTLTGSPQLMGRPINPLLDALSQLDVKTEWVRDSSLVKVRGPLRGGAVSIRGDVSSQFISAIILAAPYALKPVNLSVKTRLESKPYVQMTIDTMRKCGVNPDTSNGLTTINVPQGEYQPLTAKIEGDWSSAAFMLAAGVLSGKVHVDNLDLNSSQADKEILHALRLMGAHIKVKGKRVTAEKSHLTAIELDLRDAPDLFPVLSILCASAQGKSKLTGLGRLKMKESDRLHVMTSGLRKMGAKIKVSKTSCTIEGGPLVGAQVESHMDHRVAMSFGVLGLAVKGETVITDQNCVDKSYPGFWEKLANLGAEMRKIR